MGAGRDEVREEADPLTAALNQDRLVIGHVSGRREAADAGKGRRLAVDEREWDRLEVGREVARRRALVGVARELQLPPLDDVAGLWETESDATRRIAVGIAARVIEVQVRIDHPADIGGDMTELRERIFELGTPVLPFVHDPVDVFELLVFLVAEPRVHKHEPVVVLDQEAAQRQGNAVALVGRNATLPQRFRHDAEHGAAVEGLAAGPGTAGRAYSAARKRQSKRAVWATNTAASNARPKSATTSPKRGRPATMPSVMPVSRATHRGIGVPGSSSAWKARWTVPPSRMATATSRIRPPTWARTPVVSTSTTAKRACSRDSDAGLEIIPSERQRHAPRPAAAAQQRAPDHRDHRPVAVVQPLLSRQQALGGHRFKPRMLELAQRGLVTCVGDGHAGPHREEIAGRGPLLAFLEGAVRAAAEHRLERMVHRLHGGEEVGHLLHTLGFLAAVQHGEPLRPDKVRRIDAAQLTVELCEDHVQ